MRSLIALVLVAYAAGFDFSQRVRYDGYSVLEVIPKTEEQNDKLLEMSIHETNLNFWQEPTSALTPVHIMVSPEHRQDLTAMLSGAGMTVGVHIENVQEAIEAEEAEINAKQSKVYDAANFNTYEDIVAELNKFVTDCPDGFTCSIASAGTSVQDRDIPVFQMAKVGGGQKSLWIDSLIHAREWLAGATTMNIMRRIINDTENDDEAKKVLARYDYIYFMPVVNPDGYSYTWSNERMWRKSRNTNSGSSCIGTDLNRNFAYAWDSVGSSNNPCHDTYHGISAASEPETQALQNFVVARKNEGREFEVFLTFHTYGRYWLVPFGDCSDPENGDKTRDVADKTARAIEAEGGGTWRDGNSCSVLYATGGSTADWAQGVADIPYCYTPELRGNGFIVPASEIGPSVAEIWAGLQRKFDAIDEI